MEDEFDESAIALYEDDDGVVHVLRYAYICPSCQMPIWDELIDGRAGHGALWKGFPLSFAIACERVELFMFRPPYVFVTAEEANRTRRILSADRN